ncbi:hypothetical protein [Streptomyces sp. NBC_01602]|uniref:hypothetical protein n=1 Tax=Streptomyces sp. NBC_01602 TaxID=2975893 RepID=UPI00386E5D2A|nr:hypothetical protein OG955_04430 [Streptomyces sp. NBC_01602]
MQVSDRFHLWQGLSRRVQDIASAHRGCLLAALPPVSETDSAPIEETAEDAAADTRAGHHARRLFEAVHALTTGRSHSSVARELGLDRRTVRKYARARTWQEVMRRPPRKPSALDPTSTICNNAGTRDSTVRRSCTRIFRPRGILATTSA